MGQRSTVRELIAEYARANGGTFTAKALVEWFGERHPDVAGATVRTQLSEASRPEGRGRHLLERIGTGVYRLKADGPDDPGDQGEPGDLSDPSDLSSPSDLSGSSDLSAPDHQGDQGARITSSEPGEEAGTEASGQPDLVLVGCVKGKQNTALPARDLYQSALFDGRRGYAERSGAHWYILSARWGLVRPAEEIAPYDLYLGGRSVSYRRAWGSFVVAQLAEEQELRGKVVEVHAGADYVEALRGPLGERGALLRTPLASYPLGSTLAWYKQRRAQACDGDDVSTPSALAADLVARLSDRTQALTPEVLRTRRQGLSVSGLYSWWVDEAGAEDLGAGLGVRIEPGAVYVGQAGATRQRSGARSDNTLFGRLAGMHLGGRAEFSTFRLSLAAVLVELLGAADEDEAALSEWMERRLSVVAVAVPDRDGLAELEGRVVAAMDPPLNLRHVESTSARRRLGELRKAWRSR